MMLSRQPVAAGTASRLHAGGWPFVTMPARPTRARRASGYPRPMTADRFSVPAADGRTLDVLACGPADGLPFVFHSGTPSGLVAYDPMTEAAAALGSLVAYDPMTEAAAALGLRTVIYSRPGYGGSAPHPGRLVADAAADVTAILDHIQAGPFVTAGWSGGGPHALACAALLPGRCLAAASMAGVAPYGGAGLDWLGDMGPENVQEFTAAADGDRALASLLEKGSAALRDITAAELAAGLGGLLSEADNAVISGEFAEYLAASFRAAVATGTAGWRDDDLAFVRDWGFPLSGGGNGAGVPITIWQGGQDRMVPYAPGGRR